MSETERAGGRAGGIAGLKGIIAKYFGYGNGNVRGPLSPATSEKIEAVGTTVLMKLIELEKGI